jgi:hypothetical protein
MMICISTLNNWRESVLRHAGPQIESDYKKLYSSSDEALLLNGGLTRARKIFFVPWQSEIQEQETRQIQQVRWCDKKTERCLFLVLIRFS